VATLRGVSDGVLLLKLARVLSLGIGSLGYNYKSYYINYREFLL